jgi:hypothetical protein
LGQSHLLDSCPSPFESCWLVSRSVARFPSFSVSLVLKWGDGIGKMNQELNSSYQAGERAAMPLGCMGKGKCFMLFL